MASLHASASALPSFLQSRILTGALILGLALLLYFNNDSATTSGIDIPTSASAGDGSSDAVDHASSMSSAATADVCSDEGISILTTALHGNPESFGLRPYWAGRKEGNANSIDTSPQPPSSSVYPGLDDNLLDSSFRGKHVYFFGDSTLYYLDQWVYRLLNTTNRTLVDDSLSSMDMSAANEAIENASPEVTFNTITYRDSETYTSGTFIVGAVGPGGTCNLSRKYAKMKAKCLKVSGGCQTVIANFGLHWLHFHGAGRTLSSCEAVHWIRYEEEWMQHMIQLAKDVGAKRLLFKTLNFICSDKYTEEYAAANSAYSAKDSNDRLVDECFQDLRNGIPKDIGDDDVRSYCHNATFNERGSTHLNERIAAFVKDHQGNMGIEIGLYNDHDIESCAYTDTSDGRHYHSLNLVRIRLLAHLLWCMGGRARQ